MMWRRVLLVVVIVLAPSLGAHAGDMFAYIDEEGVYVVTDRPQDPRAKRYTPGDFERWALHYVQEPHEGLGGFSRGRAPAGRKARRFDDLLVKAAERHGVSFPLLKAVVAAESGFNPAARSRAGAVGLMQLMPATAQELGVRDRLDPAQNVDGGTRYLAMLLRLFSSERLALAAYNAGPGRVARLGRIPEIPETQAYVKKVLLLREEYARAPSGPGRRWR
ncbi:MAG: lytic transglycosylase domain-containing protein [Myxococcota bacterium]